MKILNILVSVIFGIANAYQWHIGNEFISIFCITGYLYLARMESLN